MKNEKSFDPTLNAYILYYLKELKALDEIREAAETAFEQNRVDEDIFDIENLEDDFDEDLDDEFDLDDLDLDGLDLDDLDKVN